MKKQPALYYGWVIVAAAFIWTSIGYGVRYSFPIFYSAILSEFGWSRASTASIFSVNLIVYGLTAPIAGTLVDRFGPKKVLTLGAILLFLGTAGASQAREMWQFYLTFSVLTASGTCLTGVTPVTTIVANWFVRRRGAALGVALAGVCIAPIYGTLVAYLISTIDWPASYLVLAGLVAFVLFPLVVIVPRRRPQDMGLLPDGDSQEQEKRVQSARRVEMPVLNQKWVATEWTLSKALKTYRFWAIFFSWFFYMGVSQLLIATHQVKFLEDVGYSPMFAALVYGLYGIIFTVGDLCGFVSDRIGRERTFTIGSTGAILGVFILLLVGGPSQPWLPLFFAVTFGFGAGINSVAISVGTADLFQGKNLGSIVGATLLGFALGGAIGPWLGGRIYDVTGSYTNAFILVIFTLALALALFWLARPGRVRPVLGRMRPAPKQPDVSPDRKER